jgi:hypothetical protein
MESTELYALGELAAYHEKMAALYKEDGEHSQPHHRRLARMHTEIMEAMDRCINSETSGEVAP